jgi:hypothetical protein
MGNADMRALIIFGDDNTKMLDELNKLPNWTLEKSTISGANEFYLKSGSNEIYIRKIANNVVETVNVLPQDAQANIPNFSSDVIQDLAKDLDAKSIRYDFRISDNDKKKI